jgi:hypothetical protein
MLAGAGLLLAAGLACRLGQPTSAVATDPPAVTLSSPLPGQLAAVGQPITIQSTSVDADGIQRVELWVDDRQIRIDTNPSAGSPYIVSQIWQSDTPGTHVILVKAYDTRGAEGRSQPLVVTFNSAAPATQTPAVAAQISPTPGEQGETTSPPGATATPTSPPGPTGTASPGAPEDPSVTPTTPSTTPVVMCTPPPCKSGEVYYCPGDCPGGCGTQCATPTPMPEPPSFDPTGIEVHPVFKPAWDRPEVGDYVGYPTEAASADRHYARQYFERGYLYWWDRPSARGLIWVIEIPQPTAKEGDSWSGPYPDTWDEGDPYSCDAARANPDGPVRGFGQLWCDRTEIAQAIGAARGDEQGTGESTQYGVVQFFQGGVMLYSPLDREVWVLFDAGNWQRHSR